MTTLYSPEGDKYETSSKVEETRLVMGYGYTTEKAAAPKPTPPKSDKS